MPLTTIPFEGFYESRLDAYIDDCIAREAINASEIESYNEERFQNIPENQQLDDHEHAALIYEAADYPAMHLAIAKVYAAEFFAFLREELGHSDPAPESLFKHEFQRLDSPREYNFETDRIFVTIEMKTAFVLFKLLPTVFLRQKVLENHSSRSGFVSFYSNDLSQWGPCHTWDANQLGTLMQASIEYFAGSTWEEDLHNRMCPHIDAIFEENVDWREYERLVREERIRKTFDEDRIERCAHTKDMFKE